MKLNETQNQYQDSIDQYEEMIDKMKAALDDAGEKDKEELQKAIDDAEDKLKDLKDEYKKWQEDTEKETGELLKDEEPDEDGDGDNEAGEDGEGEVIKQEPNKPIDDDEVEDVKDELSQPLDAGDEGEPTGEGEPVTDDEFISFMGEEPTGEGEPTDDEVFEPTEEPAEEPTEEPGEEFTEEPIENPEDELEEPDEEQFKQVEFPEDKIEPQDNINVSDETLRDEDVFNDEGQGEVLPSDITYDEEPSQGEIFKDELPEEPAEPVEEPEINAEPAENPEGETYQPDFSYKIANVMFNENVKDGTKEKSGSVIIIVPMVDGAGRKYIENKTVEFYLNDEDNMPILDNEPMTNELYAAVIDAIKSHPDYPIVCDTAESATVESPSIDSLEKVKADDLKSDILKSDEDEEQDWEAEYLRDESGEDQIGEPAPAEYPGIEDNHIEPESEPESEPVRDYPRYEDGPIDKMPNWGFEDKTEPWTEGKDEEPTDEFGFKLSDFADDESPAEPADAEKPEDEDEDEDEKEDVIIPTYKDGETEIEFPAANVDNTIIPESVQPRLTEKRKISIKPEFKTKDGKRFF